MASQLPTTMRAIALTKFSNPSDYDHASLPVPQIKDQDEVLIKIHAASVNPVDVKMASPSVGKLMDPQAKFPYQIGYDVSGTVVAAGSNVKNFSIGDEVYSRVPASHRGTLAEYITTPAYYISLKPKSLTFVEAASIPLAAVTAFQVLREADSRLPGGLAGKTVLIPAGLGGTGSFGVQIAKNYFKVGKVITTLSTRKIATFHEILGEGVVDQVIDYTKGNASVIEQIGKGTVDFLFDTAGQSIALVATLKPKTGLILSISFVPSGSEMAKLCPGVVWYLKYILDAAEFGVKRYLGNWWGVSYSYYLLEPNGKDLETLKDLVESGGLKPIIGNVVGLEDLDGVRKGCTQILEGKGGVGKFVVEVIKD